MPLYQYRAEQVLHADRKTVWAFMSSPKNLKEIAPEYMGFDITSEAPEKMYAGMIISYKVKPLLGIPMTWVTEITHVEEEQYFVDEQRVGPYSIWHHEHILVDHPDGILMKDIVSYKPPMGILGAVANAVMIRSKIGEIFEYRRVKLEEIFNQEK